MRCDILWWPVADLTTAQHRLWGGRYDFISYYQLPKTAIKFSPKSTRVRQNEGFDFIHLLRDSVNAGHANVPFDSVMKRTRWAMKRLACILLTSSGLCRTYLRSSWMKTFGVDANEIPWSLDQVEFLSVNTMSITFIIFPLMGLVKVSAILLGTPI
jgi:hypothetical protein